MFGLRSRYAVPGQAVLLVALILPFVVALLFTALEVSSRMLQRQAVEDALRQAARSGLQTFDYEAFANNEQALVNSSKVRAIANDVLVTNLQSVDGLKQNATATAALVQWTILPTGGTCNGQTFNTPVVCAQLDVPMQPLVPFMGSWTPRIEAVEVIDRIDN